VTNRFVIDSRYGSQTRGDILTGEAVEETLHFSMTCIEEVDDAKAFTEEILDRLKS
jgi:hypothetical protein